MTSFIFYLLQVNVVLVLLFLCYKLFFAKDTFFAWHRLALLLIPLVSVVAPLLPRLFPIAIPVMRSAVVGDLLLTVQLPDVVVGADDTSSTPVSALLLGIYIGGALLLLLYTLYAFCRLLLLLRKSKPVVINQVLVYLMEEEVSPFSFLSWICLSAKSSASDQIDRVLIHEQAHIRQFHSFDILYTQLFLILCWFNPIAWLLMREVKINHEYLADKAVMCAGSNKKEYQYQLLYTAFPSLAAANLYNNFNVLPLKKRIMMLNKKPSPKILKSKYLLFIPIMAIVCLFVNCTSSATPDASIKAEGNSDEVGVVSNSSDGAESSTNDNVMDGEPTFDVVENMPQFPGGMPAMMTYLSQNIKYPEVAKDANVGGRVILQFVVDKEGAVKDIKVARGVSPELDAEAIRVVAGMPKWTPGTQSGKKVNVRYTIPVLFKLQ